MLPRRLAMLAAVFAACSHAHEAGAASLTLACMPIGEAVAHCKAAAAEWSARSGVAVRVITAAGEQRDALDAYEDLLGIESPRLDVISFPAKWGPTLAASLEDLSVGDAADAPLEMAASLGRFGIRQVGMPQHLAVGMLYYRSDLVEPPTLWRDLVESAEGVLQATEQGPRAGLIFPSKPAGDMFATMVEWIASAGSPSIVGGDSQPAASAATIEAALGQFDAWVGSVISPESAQLDRTQSMTAFREGRALFMRHWSYLYPALVDHAPSGEGSETLSPVPTDMARLPHGSDVSKSHGALAVWMLGVSKSSQHTSAAKDLVAHLTSEQVQRSAAIDFGLAPTIESLYADASVLEARPWLGLVRQAIDGALAPPIAALGANYLEAVDAIAAIGRDLIASGLNAADATADIESVIGRIRRGATN